MKIIKEMLTTEKYDFLQTNEHLGKHIILLALGGSYAYGTNIQGSDIDIRGVALNSKKEILLGKDFEQVEDKPTDTVIYSFNKMLKLLCSCNPNIIEILGCLPEHYLCVSDIGREIIENKKIFLSKSCIKTFGGYVTSEFKKLNSFVEKGIDANKLSKHMEHMVRVYVMGTELLETGNITTYREKEHALLMDIRTGQYLKNGKPIPQFYELMHILDAKFAYAKDATCLPDKPNYKKIEEFQMNVNELIVRNSSNT